MWVNSEWGLRFYLESEGALPLLRTQTIRPGEIVAGSDLAQPVAVTAPVTRLLEREVSPSLVLNVNVPDVPLAELRGLRQAGLAEFGAVQAEVREIGKGYATITFSHIDAEYEADTDAALVRDGWATVTALASPCEAVSMDVSELTRASAATGDGALGR